MASWSEENLQCSICLDIYKEPVILSCSHSFCKSCLQTWWTGKTTLDCPVCKERSSRRNPPLNLALKNVCEAFSQRRTERPSKESTTCCCLHSENLRFFCMDHQQPVCFICLQSETHTNHSIRPINEAARHCKERLQELLRPLQEKLGLFTKIKASFDQTAQDIEFQTHDTEMQMREVFLMIRTFLQKEEEERIAALREEGEQKSQMKRRNSRALSREISALSDTIRGAEEVLREKDLPFLQRYNTTAELLHSFQSNDPQLTSGARIDVNKHLNNLPFKILDSMKEKVISSLNPHSPDPEPSVVSPGYNLYRRVRGRWSAYDGGFFGPSQRGAMSRRPLSLDLRRRSLSMERLPFTLDQELRYPGYTPLSSERLQPWYDWSSAGILR